LPDRPPGKVTAPWIVALADWHRGARGPLTEDMKAAVATILQAEKKRKADQPAAAVAS